MKYTGEYTREISFPLGGIGTGCVGLAGNGSLIDFEIFNRPNKGSINSYTHFAIKAVKDGKPTTYILNGDIQKEFMGQYFKTAYFKGYGYGPLSQKMVGFPHFRNTVFDGEFPIAAVDFSDEKFPGSVRMTAFNPFIPGDAKNSSIPAAFFEFEVANTEDCEMKYQIAFSFGNPYKVSRNSAKRENGVSTLTFTNAEVDKNCLEYGDITIATDAERAFTQTYWYRGGWQDTIVSFWDDINSAEDLKDRIYDTDGSYDMGTLAAEVTVGAKKTEKIRFILSWNVPNNYNYWSDSFKDRAKDHPWKNYYATLFESSLASACYCLDNYDSLYGRTLKFKEALYSSTLPGKMTEAAAANLSVLKSPTVLRLEDGSFYGWEGVHEQAGSCEGTCQHVWNYAYALCFLFPELERSIRDLEFKYNTYDNGKMGFRLLIPFARGINPGRACLDGQMGTVIKCYREWKLSGDNEWLKSHWENIKKIVEYAWSEENPDMWDRDKDGVLEGRQHHTLDMELFGPSSWLEGLYLAALKAASEMAEFLGDGEKAKEYRGLFEKGREWTKNNLFNGRYFIQKTDIKNKAELEKYMNAVVYWNDETVREDIMKYWNDEVGEIKYQIADGSSIDQVLAQWHADINGLGEIFDREQLDTAIDSMMKNNYVSCMRDHTNPWRIYSLYDEAGSIICTYPDGAKKPRIPIPYCEETMTGFEYSFAGVLASNGKISDAVKVTDAVRDRFDGAKRNPFNEFECGSNYARSMASYALIPIMSGFEFDLPNAHIGFCPRITGDFKSVWSVDGAWGGFSLSGNKAAVSVAEGSVTLRSLGCKFFESVSEVKIDGRCVEFEYANGRITFSETSVVNLVEITA